MPRKRKPTVRQLAAAKGGNARAQALNQEARSDIAQQAATARWGTTKPHAYVGKRYNTAKCATCGRGFRATCHTKADQAKKHALGGVSG